MMSFLRRLAAGRGAAVDKADLAAHLEVLLEAVGQPAAVCELDGHVALGNRLWREAVGEGRRPLDSGKGLFAAFRAARRTGHGEGVLSVRGGDRPVIIAGVGEGRFLARLPAAPGEAPADMGASGMAPVLPARLTGPAPFGAALIDGADPFTGAIVEANPALWAIAGGEAAPEATLGDLIAGASRVEVVAQRAEGHPGPFEVALVRAPDRSAQLYLVPAELAPERVGIAAYLLDVTAQKDLQLQLAQRNKMEAIGQLAGGVAHDFNNLLSAIGMRIDELLLRHPLGDPAYENLSEVREGVNRAAALVLQLLTFSRKATVRREAVDLSDALVEFEILLRRLLRENMRLETDYEPGAPLVRIDKAQLEMAIMNLVVNARDAMRAGGGGVIRLRTARLDAARAKALGYPGHAQGDMALIEVSDNGPGIPAGVIDSIFEPFFTTKAVGEGTGLGLATVYGIVKQADGAIVAVSPPGQGATFRIFLPSYTPRLTVEAPPSAPPRRAARDLSGAGRILFVEDEDRVRDIAARLLRGRGYEVIEGRDGEEALELAKANAGRIDLMISDVSMPGMDGPALLKAARPYLGAAPVMFISGYAESEFSELLEGETGISFLPKPLHLQSLAERVKERLRGG
jgi:two-component system cell cycle sensor histidine kinase/response regulator CckA